MIFCDCTARTTVDAIQVSRNTEKAIATRTNTGGLPDYFLRD